MKENSVMVYRREDLFQRLIDVKSLRTIKHRTTAFASIDLTFIEARSAQTRRSESTHAARTSTLLSVFFCAGKKSVLENPTLLLFC